MPKRDYDKLLSTLKKFNVELYLLYKDIGLGDAILVNSSIRWYKLVSYIIIEEDNNNHSKVYLHLNDFITIQEEEYKESYTIIKKIFNIKAMMKIIMPLSL